MERDITQRLLAWKIKKKRHPLIIKGARQVGKTYSLKAFGAEHFSRWHYVNFEEDVKLQKIFKEELNPGRILSELSFHIDTSIDTDNDLIIFDEIQTCPRALTSLKYFSENMPQLAICCAGSLLGLHFGISSFPVGKVDFLDMYPMSFPEFLAGIGETRAHEYLMNFRLDTQLPEIVHSKLWGLLKTYFITGGLPEVVEIYRENKGDQFQALQLVREKQDNLILSYEADMARHSGKQNSMHLSRVWRNIPAQLAREQDGSAPKFKFKDVIPEIKGYSRLSGIIDWLRTAGIVIKSYIIDRGQLPFSAFQKENVFKLYLFDIGILGAISRLQPKTILDYDFGTYKGYFAENFAAQEFLCAGENELYSWREVTSEVEFLREVDGGIVPVEIKSGWVTKAKSLQVYADKYGPDYRVVMSARPLKIDKGNKRHGYPLYLASRFPLPRD